MRLALTAALVLAPVLASALEPRFDHSDTEGPVAELLMAHDTVVAGSHTFESWRPALRVGWGFDVTGEGSEVILSSDVALRSFDDPDRGRVLLTTSARFRTYFGTEQWKTFFEGGLWVPVLSRLAAGPLIGLGAVYDFSQDAGVFAGAEFETAIGDGHIISFAGIAGVQVRFDIP